MPLVTTHLTAAQFDAWRAHQTREQARAKVANASWSEHRSFARAEADTQTLLPQGNETPGHHIRRIEHQTTGQLIGHIWVGRATEGAPGLAWLLDIEIVPARPRPRPRPCRHDPRSNRSQTPRPSAGPIFVRQCGSGFMPDTPCPSAVQFAQPSPSPGFSSSMTTGSS